MYHLESRTDFHSVVVITSSVDNTTKLKELPFLIGLLISVVSLYKEKMYGLGCWAYNAKLQHTLGPKFIFT